MSVSCPVQDISDLISRIRSQKEVEKEQVSVPLLLPQPLLKSEESQDAREAKQEALKEAAHKERVHGLRMLTEMARSQSRSEARFKVMKREETEIRNLVRMRQAEQEHSNKEKERRKEQQGI